MMITVMEKDIFSFASSGVLMMMMVFTMGTFDNLIRCNYPQKNKRFENFHFTRSKKISGLNGFLCEMILLQNKLPRQLLMAKKLFIRKML